MSFKKRTYRKTVSNLEIEQFLRVAFDSWFEYWFKRSAVKELAHEASREGYKLIDIYDSSLASDVIVVLDEILSAKCRNAEIKMRKAFYGSKEREIPKSMLPTNEDVKNIFNEVYNGWFVKWRDFDFKEQSEWDKCLEEGKELRNKHRFDLTEDLVAALYAELARRDKEKKGRT